MLNGDNELKGQVSLDSRSIVITSSEAMQDTNDLKLVSVEKTTESHLIDFRLLRTCNIDATLLNGKLRLNFSPMPLKIEVKMITSISRSTSLITEMLFPKSTKPWNK
jgi:hypothetical protein